MCGVWGGGGVALSQALPDPLPNKNKKGESLEDFGAWLDMVGRGLELFDHTSKEYLLNFVHPEMACR